MSTIIALEFKEFFDKDFDTNYKGIQSLFMK